VFDAHVPRLDARRIDVGIHGRQRSARRVHRIGADVDRVRIPADIPVRIVEQPGRIADQRAVAVGRRRGEIVEVLAARVVVHERV